MALHKFGYAEEMFHTRIIEGIKEKQESHEKIAHTKLQRTVNDIDEKTKKWKILNLLMKSAVHKERN